MTTNQATIVAEQAVETDYFARKLAERKANQERTKELHDKEWKAAQPRIEAETLQLHKDALYYLENLGKNECWANDFSKALSKIEDKIYMMGWDAEDGFVFNKYPFFIMSGWYESYAEERHMTGITIFDFSQEDNEEYDRGLLYDDMLEVAKNYLKDFIADNK